MIDFKKKAIIFLFPCISLGQHSYFTHSFSKLLDHDSKTGLLTIHGQKNYQQLQKALQTGSQADFNAIERAKGIKRLWANPQASFIPSSMHGRLMDIPLEPPPTLTSAQAAADLIELYAMAWCRDVAFSDYGTGKKTDSNGTGGSLTKNASQILTKLGAAYKGPKKHGNKVDTTVLFRGTSAGDLIGPYISQFLIQPFFPLFPSDPTDVGAEQLPKHLFQNDRKIPILSQREFGVTWADFIQIQNGHIPKKFLPTDCNRNHLRYPINGRDVACSVYTDVSYDFYYYALRVLECNEFPYSKTFPYQKGIMKNESSGATMGLSDVYSLIACVCQQAYAACWYYKWRVYCRLRPEAMAGLVHQAFISGNNQFDLHKTLLDSYLLDLILQHNQKQADLLIVSHGVLTLANSSTYLLPQVYPEGSPTHPSFPAAHATVAGACVTILKAFFDENTLFSSKVKILIPDPTDPTKLKYYNQLDSKKMTVGSELDKLASNIAYGRSWAGIHFRSDNEAGLKLGEDIALILLAEHAKRYHEKCFDGFELTTRAGMKIKIK